MEMSTNKNCENCASNGNCKNRKNCLAGVIPCQWKAGANYPKTKLTKEDKELLFGWGFSEQDFSQIEEAFKKSKTVYELGGKTISREEAVSLLGWREYLSGIARSAFHFSAARETEDGRFVHFNSSKIFQ